MLFVGSFTTSSERFSQFNDGIVILFQIKIFNRNIKKTTPAGYSIKVTPRPSFTRLRVIWHIIEFLKYENRKYLTQIQLHLLLI